MNRKVLKSILIIGTVIIMTLLLSTVSNAALSISTSKSTVSPGESFNVTVSVSSNEAGDIYLSASNGTLSQTHIDLMTQSSVTVNCVAGSSGTVSISASGTVANYTTETEEPQSASKSISIVVPTTEPPTTGDNSGGSQSNSNTNSNNNNNTTTTPTKSSNSRLSSLQIAEGVISPEFDSSVREYTINVPNEITKLSIAAVADHSKATVRITGNEELQVGENTIEIIVTAENGSTTTYKILATRELPELNLEKLSIYYINEEGNKIELILDPQFVSNIYEYVVTEKLSNKVEKIEIETTANRENAKIEIVGNDELKAGKNEITIKVTLEDEAGLEEQKTYKITVEREEEPVVATLTTWEKIENWFTGVGSTIGKWVSTNIEKIITGMLIVATATFVGLTIYFAYDYKNYKSLLSKLAELNKTNLMERANIALDPENVEKNINEENIEEVKSGTDKVQEIQQEEKKEVKSGKGKRFK